jgi:hypothetical protein
MVEAEVKAQEKKEKAAEKIKEEPTFDNIMDDKVKQKTAMIILEPSLKKDGHLKDTPMVIE